MDQRVALDPRPGHQQHTEVAVLDGRADRLAGDLARALLVGVKAVIGADHHGGVVTGQFQHHVVEAVAGLDHALVALIIGLRDEVPARRVIFHEAVAEVVDGVKVHRTQVPILVLH